MSEKRHHHANNHSNTLTDINIRELNNLLPYFGSEGERKRKVRVACGPRLAPSFVNCSTSLRLLSAQRKLAFLVEKHVDGWPVRKISVRKRKKLSQCQLSLQGNSYSKTIYSSRFSVYYSPR